MKNIFICHRPYHILRSADLIYKEHKSDQNILIVFDVISYRTSNYTFPDILDKLSPYFNEVVKISRKGEVRRVYYLYKFYQYYHKTVEEFSGIVRRFEDFDSLFFFSDQERPVEILVSLFNMGNNRKKRITLVDEGLASYYKTGSLIKDIVFGSIIKIFRYRLLNKLSSYGTFDRYTHSLAAFPERAVFHGKIDLLRPLDREFCRNLQSKFNVNIGDKSFIYLDNVIESKGVKQEEELKFLIQLKAFWEERGYSFFLKPHPSQNDERFCGFFENDVILDKTIPSELFFSPYVIIGSVGSSSLINAYLQHCRAINLSGFFNVSSEITNMEWIQIPVIHNFIELIHYEENL